MKNKKNFIIFIAVIVAVFVTAVILVCVFRKPENSSQKQQEKLNSYVQDLNYNESIKNINNPDQGFYRPIYVMMTESGVTYDKSILSGSNQLYHLRVDISAFSKVSNNDVDKVLTEDALIGLEELLNFVKENGKNVIVRFAYDPGFSGKSNMEPALEMIIKHIKQVCPVLNKFESTITAIETGLIGPWGEMHTSTIANAENIFHIIETFLNSTNNLHILTRTPKMICNYLGITINDIENFVVESTSKAYRLGIYNDGYLGSENDLGTYINREKEIEFLSKLTNHIAFGGEVVVPGSTLHNIDVCLPEMFKLNLSYLNKKWNNEVINKWENTYYTSDCGDDKIYYGQTAFTYIENHMGYRFVLKKSTFEYSDKFDKFNVKLSLENVGFGNLNKSKSAKLLFVDENGEIKLSRQMSDFVGNENIEFSTTLDLENGKYKVYLCIYGDEVDGKTLYNLQFSNEDIWNDELGANRIGEIVVKK